MKPGLLLGGLGRTLLIEAAVDPAIPLGLLAKLRSWYDLESTHNDGWGPHPLVTGSSAGSFVSAATYGSGIAGNCLVSSSYRSNYSVPDYGTGKAYFLGAFRSTGLFFDNQLTCFFGKAGFNDSLSLSETASGFEARGVLDSAGPAVYRAGSTDAIDTWVLTVAQHSSAGTVRYHKNSTLNAATDAGNVNLNPTDYFSLGTVAGAAQGAAATKMFWGEGELTSDELSYLYNGGAGRTISEIITDSGYVQPTTRFTQNYLPTYAKSAISYSGTRVGHDITDPVTCLNYTNTGKTSGKHVFAVRLNNALDGASVYFGVRTGPVTGEGGAYLSTTSAATGTFQSGPFSAGAAPGLSVTSPGDVYMFAVDFSSLEVWAGKNGTWSGDPSAGTGAAWTFSSGYEFFVWCQENDVNFGADFYFTTADYPYTPPTGFTPWGD